MTQINKSFGSTLEFSTTVNGGKITSQELVSSGPDCLVSFKMDKFLQPKDLRDIASEVQQALGAGLKLATGDEVSLYMTRAKAFLIDTTVFTNIAVHSIVIAEFLANQDSLTLYSERVSVEPEPVDPTEDEELDGDDYDEDEDDYDEDDYSYDDSDDYDEEDDEYDEEDDE